MSEKHLTDSPDRSQVSATMLVGVVVALALALLGLVTLAVPASADSTDSARRALVKALVVKRAVTEGDATSQVKVPIKLTRKAKRRTVVQWRTVAGSAKAGQDFRDARGKAVFKKGQRVKRVGVTVLADLVHEETESFFVKITKVRGAAIKKRKAPVVIRDNDPVLPALPRMAFGDVSIPEGGSLELPVVLSAAPTSPAVVGYAIEALPGNAAEPGTDFEAAMGTLTFAPGQVIQLIPVATLTDTEPETGEAFRVRFFDASGATLPEVPFSTITIIDGSGGGLPIVGALPVPLPVAEGLPVTTLLTLDSVPTAPVTVDWIAVPGSAGADDLEATAGSVTFAIGETTKVLTLGTVDDSLPEGTESFTLLLSGISGGILPDPSSVPVSILDNDSGGGGGLPIVDDLPNVLPVAEGTPFSIPIALGSAPTAPVSIAWSVVPGTASAADLTTTGGTLTYGVGETLKSITLGTVNDSVREGAESFTLRLDSITGGALPATRTIPLSILDNDPVPTVTPSTVSFVDNPLSADSVSAGLTLTNATTDAVSGTVTALLLGVPVGSAPFSIAPGGLSTQSVIDVGMQVIPNAGAITYQLSNLSGAVAP